MRTQYECEMFAADAERRVDPPRAGYEAQMYRGCIPEMHWFVRSGDVKHNREPFKGYILPYTKRMKRAYRHGYSMLMIGDNGTGKTMFTSYMLGRAVRKGFSVYYTTLSQLDADIKAGFNDPDAASFLRRLTSSDFLAIDELGKEHFRKDSWLNTQLEGLLKQRYDDGLPVFLASNVEFAALAEMYGPTITSMMEGRYQTVQLEGGDYRAKSSAAMRKEMGYS